VKVEVLAAADLGAPEVARWSELQQADASYRSPFFRPEFMSAVARVRDVRVAVIEEAGAVAGFFPFEVCARRTGRPLGWPHSNYHGPVVDAAASVEPRHLVRASGLATWSFDHLPIELTAFAPYAFGQGRSPYLDLSDGFEPYVYSRRAHSDVRDTLGKTARRLAREVGPVRFVPESDAADLLAQLLEWKRRQYAETGVRDTLADAGSRELLGQVHAMGGAGFAGALSVLYAGDVVVALQFGLRSGSVWHCWFPAYNRELRRYSPGLMLLLELARAAPPLGVCEIDLGKGEAPYKLVLATGSQSLHEGCVGARPLSAFPVRVRTSARHVLRRTGVNRALRRTLHRMRREPAPLGPEPAVSNQRAYRAVHGADGSAPTPAGVAPGGLQREERPGVGRDDGDPPHRELSETVLRAVEDEAASQPEADGLRDRSRGRAAIGIGEIPGWTAKELCQALDRRAHVVLDRAGR
jgi:CelD/BcsL family acetyltransferase involved in cellulose biosynthesis